MWLWAIDIICTTDVMLGAYKANFCACMHTLNFPSELYLHEWMSVWVEVILHLHYMTVQLTSTEIISGIIILLYNVMHAHECDGNHASAAIIHINI